MGAFWKTAKSDEKEDYIFDNENLPNSCPVLKIGTVYVPQNWRQKLSLFKNLLSSIKNMWILKKNIGAE